MSDIDFKLTQIHTTDERPQNVSSEDEQQPRNEPTDTGKGDFADAIEKETGIELETLNDLASAEIPPSGIFRRNIDRIFECTIDVNVWNELYKSRYKQGKYWFLGSKKWQKVMREYMKRGNPFCSFAFKFQRVMGGVKRQARTELRFRAIAYCMNNACSLKKVAVTLDKDYLLRVDYGGATIDHDVTDITSTPISGSERQELKNKMKDSKSSASVVYSQQLADLDDEVFVCGNRDGIGRNPQVLRQIIHEANTDGRLDATKEKGRDINFFPPIFSTMTENDSSTNTNVNTSSVNGDKKFVCGICQEPFMHRSSLSRHKKSHVEAASHVCVGCNRSYSRKEKVSVSP